MPQIEAFVDIEDRDDEGKVTCCGPSRKTCWSWRNGGPASLISMPATTRALSAWMTALCRSTPATAPCGSFPEVLHDRLLAPVRAGSHPHPKDVVVMMPDVNSYGPYIQAVFGKRGGKGRAGPAARSPLRSPIGRRARRACCCKVSSPCSGCRTPASGRGAARHPGGARRAAPLRAGRRRVQRAAALGAGDRHPLGLDDDYPERFALPRLSGNSWLLACGACCWVFAMGTGAGGGDPALCGHRGAAGLILGKLAWFVDSPGGVSAPAATGTAAGRMARLPAGAAGALLSRRRG